MTYTTWEEVQEWFGMDDPEPDALFYAEYDGGGYEGRANVLYRVGDKYFYVYGSHCSCYGLEGQWQPEEYSIDDLRGLADRATYGFFKDQKALIHQIVG